MSEEERYKVIAAAGSGGFGVVHHAHDLVLERDVAMKILSPIFKLKPSDIDKERFRREAKYLAKLSHPNIPAIYDVRFDEPTEDFRIFCEWIDGTTIAKHLLEKGPIVPDRALRIFTNVCSALEHAHSRKIIHRDIKPNNMILSVVSDACYLVDFGISLSLTKEELEKLTGSTAIGTPGYMSPEQSRGESLTPASDIYTLAIVLYECLSGQRPQVGIYNPLSSLTDAIPQAIDRLIQDCLREKAEDRIKSAADFASRLGRALEPHADFSDTLANGTLFEIQAALGAMSPKAYSLLPAGQRALIVTRLKDLVNVDEERPRRAVAALLAALTRCAHEARLEHYSVIVQHAVHYGYEKQYGTWFGNEEIRQELEEVSLRLGAEAHSILAAGITAYVAKTGMDAKGAWWSHSLRRLLQNLLANPACNDANAEVLSDQLQSLNLKTH